MAAEETLETFDPQAQIRQAAALARRHLFFLGTMVLAGLLIGIGLFLFLPKEYESEAKIMIRSGWMLDSRETLGEKIQITVRASTLEDQVKSTLWLETVLDRLEWPEWARVRLNPVESRLFINKMKRRVNVRMQKGETGERLVFLKFQYPDAYKARDFVAALLDHWLSEVVDSHRKDLDREVAIRAQQVEEKDRALQRSRKDLEDFEISSGTSRLSPYQEYTTRRDQLSEDLSEVEQTRMELSAQEGKLEERLKEVNDRGILKLPRELPEEREIENPEYKQKVQLVELIVAEIGRLELRNLTEKHPSMISARDRLERAILSLVEVPPTLVVREEAKENPAWRMVIDEISKLQVQLAGLQAREEGLRAGLREVASVLETLPPKLGRLDELNFAKQAAEEAISEARILLNPLRDQQNALSRMGATDALPYSRLEEPEAAVKPSLSMGIFGLLVSLGLFSGLGLAWILGSELFKTSFGTSEQVRRALRVPVLGEVGVVLTAPEARRNRAQRKLQIVASLMVLAGLAATIYVCTVHADLLPTWLVQQAGRLREGLL